MTPKEPVNPQPRFMHTQEQRMFQILTVSWKAQGGIIMPYLHRSFIDKRPSTSCFDNGPMSAGKRGTHGLELIDWPVEGGAGRKPEQAAQETPSLLMGQAGG